jgi:hypothetical protein
MAIHQLLLVIAVLLVESVASKSCIGMTTVRYQLTFVLKGQTSRLTSGCSVSLCPSKNNTNTSCSSANTQICYAYQVSLTNEIFCGPSVACSLFETCTANGTCSLNTSVCLSNTCCSQPICMPISLGVVTCNTRKSIYQVLGVKVSVEASCKFNLINGENKVTRMGRSS